MYNVSYFCAVGNPMKQNQDRVLVNGELLRDGLRHCTNVKSLCCFVADGVGSMYNSGNAAEYVLSELSKSDLPFCDDLQANLRKRLESINDNLVKLNNIPGIYRDSATTLCGLLIDDDTLLPVNVGDSEILIMRGNKLFRITTPQVMDAELPNSPITSYLGDCTSQMEIDFSFRDYQPCPTDLIIVTTDGLMKAISETDLLEHLSANSPWEARISGLYTHLCHKPVPDNLGAVFIEKIQA